MTPVRLLALKALRHWMDDPDFVGVRAPEALAKLLGEEQRSWQALGEEVATLLKTAPAVRT